MEKWDKIILVTLLSIVIFAIGYCAGIAIINYIFKGVII